MTQAVEKKTYTPEEYLESEVLSEERHEYIDGEIRLMTGGTPNHNDLAGNLLIILKLALKKQPYQNFYYRSASFNFRTQYLYLPRHHGFETAN